MMIQAVVYGSSVSHIVVVRVWGRVVWLVFTSNLEEQSVSVLNLSLDVARSTETLRPTGVITQKTTVWTLIVVKIFKPLQN
jgi:hypothetical protein